MATLDNSTIGQHRSTLLNTRTGKAAAVLGAVLLLTVSARVQVPFWPVPMTLQTLTVLLIGHFLGFRLAMATLATYLLSGAAGLPMFAGTPERGLGLVYMAGPTGGYLLGFVVAAAITSQIDRLRNVLGRLALPGGLLVASAAIHLFGFAWLGLHVGPEAALTAGVLPFIPGDLVKFGLALLICYRYAPSRRQA